MNAVSPVVFARGETVLANSRDVAACFEKRHNNVLRDIENILSRGGMLNFEHTPWFREAWSENPQNGQPYRSYDMTRDGFTLLAMGFTGAKALQFKLHYIAAFNEMEAELKRAAAPALDGPVSDLRVAVELVREARLTFGRAAARRLWRSLPLPQIEDAPALPPADDRAGLDCLRHLLDTDLAGKGGDLRTVGEWARAATGSSELADDTLLAHGLAVRPAPRPRDRRAPHAPGLFLWVAHRHPALPHLFEGTPWRDRGWAWPLSGLPGAMNRVSFWCNGQTKAVLIPLGLCFSQEPSG